MLQALHIENIAVIRKADIDFSTGLSVLTGETGAGKSILIDSIGFILGHRAGRELLRKGAERALVSALFWVSDDEKRRALLSLGVEPDADGGLLLERTLNGEGRTLAKINGRPANLSLLRSVGGLLVSIHGQNDTGALTARENQLEILDRYAELSSSLTEYREVFARLSEIRATARKITLEESARQRELEMLAYQISDIDALSLVEGEEETLLEKRVRLRSADRIAKQASFAYRALRSAEKANVIYVMDRAIAAVQALEDVIPEAAVLSLELLDCRDRIDDAAERIRSFSEEDEGDAAKLLDRVEGRLAAIERLRRKYGGTVAEILSFLSDAKERYALLEQADDRLKDLRREEAVLLAKAESLAAELSARRARAAGELSERITAILALLDMPKVDFGVALTKTELTSNGADAVDFMIATNPGEPAMPLSSVASGGELARVMLAVKSVISDRDGMDTVIYDEIDSGVSGKTARRVGIELLRSSHGMQVLCVTHSAQIASLADTHYLIRKQEIEGRAETDVLSLDEEGRITEIARILGGIDVTEAQRRAAQELYAERSAYLEG